MEKNLIKEQHISDICKSKAAFLGRSIDCWDNQFCNTIVGVIK